ncbi:hypothetical protein GZ77_12045 [Endozoicomonas montiporae]|uniref:DUF58 domain-containing protein n=2 Tax=Endozoicomonas montiporae TaxID=1027273 RepID=A0A081N941_9GAMM|nr:DUF58 domain-containing protein [Endozoicomonas montiporae]AMO55096.1 hypothetical protein EZMO1_0878 [Endozoicomonas montiporae CL-33]KEQ14964.1 hypothetical protein GZ77_12045 [Endozoicomonas montiporae]
MHDHLTQRLHQLQLFCKHRVDHLLAGQYRSTFKGQGLEFDEVRVYSPGDDVRTIDWNVTARSSEVHIKRFHEEREINLILVVDNSPSFAWSSTDNKRQTVAAKLCGLLGMAAFSSNDRIGLLRFSDTMDSFLPPTRGRNQLMRCLSSVLEEPKKVSNTCVTESLDHLNKLQLKRSVIVVISDFFMEGFMERLAILGHHHEVIAIAVDDPGETSLTGGGLMHLRDTETGETQWLDLANRSVQKLFKRRMDKRLKDREQAFAQWGVDLVVHHVDDDPAETLLSFFHARKKRVEGAACG